jgi:hypothetical protein
MLKHYKGEDDLKRILDSKVGFSELLGGDLRHRVTHGWAKLQQRLILLPFTSDFLLLPQSKRPQYSMIWLQNCTS